GIGLARDALAEERNRFLALSRPRQRLPRQELLLWPERHTCCCNERLMRQVDGLRTRISCSCGPQAVHRGGQTWLSCDQHLRLQQLLAFGAYSLRSSDRRRPAA